MYDLRPGDGGLIDEFLNVYRRLCPTVNDDVSIQTFAQHLGWSIDETRKVALWLDERRLIDTDRGMGGEITMIDGRNGT